MNKTLTLLSFLALIAFLGGVVYGHADQSISQSVPGEKAFSHPHLFSEITRATVKDSQGGYAGRITDLVIDPEGGISFVILSPMGMDVTYERLVALPLNTVTFDNKYLVLDTTSEKLVNAPLFRRNYLIARNWAEDANRYFGVQPSWGGGRERDSCEMTTDVSHQISMIKGWNRPYEATEVVGTKVRDPQGEEVGKIEDLVFDDKGRISFAIVGYGGFLGIGQNLVAVPVNSLSYDEESRHFVVDATKEKTQFAPLFSKKALDDPGWADGIYRYFGQQPYWTEEK
ncbi:MAG TPA: PRC-barrel domain-containing protein [Thermodesulfobacteriota bacterium]|nr:PRC-barrel domain-containing protein [Thermodesulfobacteriota bacterium]